jgi:hypothetical protein
MSFEKMLILSGLPILMGVLVFVFRKGITLAVIRLIYGQYSFNYVNIHKRFYVKSPFKYCFKDDFIVHILNVLVKKQDIPTFISHQDIFFEKTPYFVDYKTFLKEKGNPKCFNAYLFNQPGFEIKALGYHSSVAGSKAIIVYYFMNDSFFMGEYIFKKPKTDVKAKMVEHFLDKKDMNEDNFYIENTKNRIIHFHNTGSTVDVKYLNREDQQIIDKLEKYYNLITGKKMVPKP